MHHIDVSLIDVYERRISVVNFVHLFAAFEGVVRILVCVDHLRVIKEIFSKLWKRNLKAIFLVHAHDRLRSFYFVAIYSLDRTFKHI